jgi:putative addiction module CopG family antidote
MVELTPEYQQFVEAQVATGIFKDTSEVIEAGLELLRKAAKQREYELTVKAISDTIPDMESGRGRTIEEVNRSIRDRLGFAQSP